MIIPIRCFSCGKPIAAYYEKFKNMVEKEGRNAEEVLNELNIKRYCCRRMLVSHVELYDLLSKYNLKR